MTSLSPCSPRRWAITPLAHARITPPHTHTHTPPPPPRYGDYARQQQFIDDAFAKFDTDASGGLEPAQLSAFLSSLDAQLKIDEGDVEFVLQQADVSGSGSIEKDELLPAVGVWLALSKKALGGAAAEEKPKSKACVLL